MVRRWAVFGSVEESMSGGATTPRPAGRCADDPGTVREAVRRWLTQLIVTERVVARKAAGPWCERRRSSGPEDELLPTVTARLEIGSVAAAARGQNPRARARRRVTRCRRQRRTTVPSPRRKHPLAIREFTGAPRLARAGAARHWGTQCVRTIAETTWRAALRDGRSGCG